MKRKIRKMIVAGITACVIMVPTVASAYSSTPTYGWDYLVSMPNKIYGWASYDHHVCYVRLISFEYQDDAAAWAYVETAPLPYRSSPSVSAHFD